MKQKYKHRKRLIELANQLGLYDINVQAVVEDPITKKQRTHLVNNQRRFVNGIMVLSLEQQAERIKELEKRMEEVHLGLTE